MIWMLPLLGAAAGALMNKKAPLNGALMGAGMGALGGAGLGAMGAGGGLLGSGAAAGSQAGMLAEQEAGLGASAYGWGGATSGLPGLLNTTSASAPGLLNTAGRAANTAATVKSLMPQEQPIKPAPPFSSGGGNGSIQGMYQNLQNNRLAQQQYEMQNRARRAQRLNSIG